MNYHVGSHVFHILWNWHITPQVIIHNVDVSGTQNNNKNREHRQRQKPITSTRNRYFLFRRDASFLRTGMLCVGSPRRVYVTLGSVFGARLIRGTPADKDRTRLRDAAEHRAAATWMRVERPRRPSKKRCAWVTPADNTRQRKYTLSKLSWIAKNIWHWHPSLQVYYCRL